MKMQIKINYKLTLFVCFLVNITLSQEINKKYSITDINNNYFLLDSLVKYKVYDSAFLNYAKEKLMHKSKIKDNLEKLKLNNYLANYYLHILNFDKTKFHCFENINSKTKKTASEQIEIANSHWYLTYLYLNFSNIKAANRHCYIAADIFEKNKNIDGYRKVKMALAEISLRLKDYKKAERLINEGLESMKEKNNLFCALILTKIRILNEIKHPETPNLIYQTYLSFRAIKNIDLSYVLAINFYLTMNYLDNGKLLKAKRVIDETEPLVKKKNIDIYNELFNNTKAAYCLASKQKLSNRDYFIKRAEINNKKNKIQLLENDYNILKYDALYRNDINDLFKYSDSLESVQMRLFAESTKKSILELQTKYKLDKKEKELKINQLIIKNKNNTILLLIIIFALIILLFIVFLILWKKRERENLKDKVTLKLFENIELERKRIANELHDNINQELILVKKQLFEKDEIICKNIDEIIENVRVISRNLHPVLFEKIGLKESILNLKDRIQNKFDLVIIDKIKYKKSFNSNIEIQIYRIIQESLSNIIKHGKAKAAKITIKENEKIFFLEIKDNGQGFNVKKTLNSVNSFGLFSMIERAKLLGGKIMINSTKSGTTITMEIKK